VEVLCHIDLEVRADSKLVLSQNPEIKFTTHIAVKTRKLKHCLETTFRVS